MIKQITLGKELKVGLPQFSNMTIRADITFELSENEEPRWDEMWDEVNRQLSIQSEGIDPTWINTKEYNNFFKTTIKSVKNVDGLSGEEEHLALKEINKPNQK